MDTSLIMTEFGWVSTKSGEAQSRWTRESVTEQLCQHLLAGTAEAGFLRRHGEPGPLLPPTGSSAASIQR
jgi:hypothetical protein